MAFSVVEWTRSFVTPVDLGIRSQKPQGTKKLWEAFTRVEQVRRSEWPRLRKFWYVLSVLLGDEVLFALWWVRNFVLQVAARLAKWSWEKLRQGSWRAILSLLVAAIIALVYAVVIAPLCILIELPLMAIVTVFSAERGYSGGIRFLYISAIAVGVLSAMVALGIVVGFSAPFAVPLLAVVAMGIFVIALRFDYKSMQGTARDHGGKPSGASIAVVLVVGLALLAGVGFCLFFPPLVAILP